MTAPDTWSAPSSGGTITSAAPSLAAVSAIAESHWFVSISPANGTANPGPSIRYATAPAGAWGTATMPAAPSTALQYQQTVFFPIDSDGGSYAFPLSYRTLGGTFKGRLLHATDPGGTWTAYEYDATDKYESYAVLHDGTQWALAGRWFGVGGNQQAFIATSGTVDGTYSFSAGSAATGYADGGGSGQAVVYDLVFDGSTYVSLGGANTVYSLRTSSSLTSGWSDPGVTFTGVPVKLRTHSNGYFTVLDNDTVIRYTNTPSGSWSSVGTADVGITDIRDVAYTNGYWIAVGGASDGTYVRPEIAYCESTGAPTGTWTTVTSPGFTEPAANLRATAALADATGYLIAATSYYGEIRWALITTTTATYLRQRQSPVRSPSRVSWKAY